MDEKKKNRKNLLIIMPDQLRADYLGCYGHPNIGTKYIDKLSREGIRFENCYCAAPLCGPSRISFVTSIYFSEHNHRDYGAEISPDIPNLVTSLKKMGYHTGMFGKNHMFEYGRLEEVWDELDEICLGNCDNHPQYKYAFSSFTMEQDHPYHITKRLTDETIQFIRQSEEPFLAWVNYQDPHPAFACPHPYDTLFSPEEITLSKSYHQYDKEREPLRNEVWRRHSKMELCTDMDMKRAMAHYMGQIRYVDDMVGQLMEALDHTGKKQDTIILFLSDHGELLGDHGMTHKLPVFYESLTRIPVIVYTPNANWNGQIFKGLVEEVDLTPTLLDLLNIHIPITMVGKSVLPQLLSGEYKGRKNIICEAGIAAPVWKRADETIKLRAPHEPTSYGCGAMIREGNWKLSVYVDDRAEFYNLDKDPQEQCNLFDCKEFREKREELMMKLLQRIMGVKIRDRGENEKWDYEEYPYDVRRMPLELMKKER